MNSPLFDIDSIRTSGLETHDRLLVPRALLFIGHTASKDISVVGFAHRPMLRPADDPMVRLLIGDRSQRSTRTVAYSPASFLWNDKGFTLSEEGLPSMTLPTERRPLAEASFALPGEMPQPFTLIDPSKVDPRARPAYELLSNGFPQVMPNSLPELEARLTPPPQRNDS